MLLKTLAALAAISAALAYAPSTAFACSCVPFTKPESARQATLVFTGTVTRVDVHSGPLVFSTMDPVEVAFEVETVYKGSPAKTTTVFTAAGDSSCGYEFVSGRRYTVFAWLLEGKLHAGLCQGNVEGAIDPQSYLLGAGYAPGADPPQTARLLIGAAAVTATLLFIAVERLRKARVA
ncbi:MAG: hypothetical protein ACRDG6_09310 [Candidatus Limnocylindria bacterium]